MMKTALTLGAVVMTANCFIANARSADCVGRDDLSALRTAALQQELMVAALTCHEVRRYNRFVTSHQDELIDSDNRLKAFFLQRSGEARYHTFKTELANAASLRSIRESDSFCANASDEFDLSERPISLAAFVARQPVVLGAGYRSCHEENGGTSLLADSSAMPARRHQHLSSDEAPPWARDTDDHRHGDADADDGYRSDRRGQKDDERGDDDN